MWKLNVDVDAKEELIELLEIALEVVKARTYEAFREEMVTLSFEPSLETHKCWNLQRVGEDAIKDLKKMKFKDFLISS